MTQYLDSLQMLLLLDDYDAMLPAHGLGIFNPKEKIRQYMEHRLAREEKIRTAIDAGLTDPKEILAAAYDDVNPMLWPLAAQSLKAHMIRLEALRREGVDPATGLPVE